MPKPATLENAEQKGEYLKDYVVMESPTGEQRTVAANPAAIIPLMTNGWKQVERGPA